MLYFDHDTDASKSDGINDLRCLCGGAAVDAYWYILEQIYRSETYWVFRKNQHVNPSVLRFLAIDEETFSTWVQTMVDFDLLSYVADGEGANAAVHSLRAKERIAAYHARIETARENGKKGGRPPGKKPKKTQSVSFGKPKANPDETEPKPKSKLIEEKKRDRFSIKENPISDSGNGGVENVPRCPECGTSMLHDSSIDGWRCRDGSCRAVLKHREAESHGVSAYCPECATKMWRNKQSGRYECPGCMQTYAAGDAVWQS